MKNITKYIALFAAAMSIAACNKADNSWYVTSDNYVLTVKSADVSFGPAESEGKIVVDTKDVVKAVSNQEWCVVNVDADTVFVKALALESLEGRNAEVTVSAGERKVVVPVHQEGLVLIIDANPSYLVNADATTPVTIPVKANCPLTANSNVEWLTVETVEDGYTITPAANESEDYRRGSVNIGPKQIWIGQWGTAGKPSIVGTYTIHFEDEEGEWYQPDVKIEAGSTADTYVIKDLLFWSETEPAVDLPLWYNASTGDYYIQNLCLLSPAISLGGSTYYLRPMMSYYNASGTKQYQTSANTSATNAYRMSFAWAADDEANLTFKYVRNSNLGSTYTTDGFEIYAYTRNNSASASYRAGVLYQFWNAYFVPQEVE